jgi:hypothetical protein
MNALRRRAVELGTDVLHIVAIDAAAERVHNQARRSELPAPFCDPPSAFAILAAPAEVVAASPLRTPPGSRGQSKKSHCVTEGVLFYGHTRQQSH